MPKIYIINYQLHTIQTSVQKWTLCSFLCTKKNQHTQNLYSHLKLYNKKNGDKTETLFSILSPSIKYRPVNNSHYR